MFREIALSIGLARGIGTALAFAITYQFAVHFGLVTYNLTLLIAFSLIGLLGWSGTDLINNYFDYDIDKKAMAERAGLVKKYGKLFLASGYTIGGSSIVLSYVIYGLPALVLTLLAGAASTLYSAPPLSLKRTAFKPLTNISISLVPFLIITISTSFNMEFFILSVFFGLAICALTIGEDIRDYDTDRGMCRTLPLIAGRGRLKELGLLMAFLSTTFALSVWYFIRLDLYYLALTIVINVAGYGLLLRNNPAEKEGRIKFGDTFVRTGVIQLLVIIVWVQAYLYS